MDSMTTAQASPFKDQESSATAAKPVRLRRTPSPWSHAPQIQRAVISSGSIVTITFIPRLALCQEFATRRERTPARRMQLLLAGTSDAGTESGDFICQHTSLAGDDTRIDIVAGGSAIRRAHQS